VHAIEELPPALPYEILKKSRELPLKPASVILQGHYVKLVPLIPARDAAALFAVSNGQPARLGDRTVEAYDADALIWRFMWEGPFATVEDFNTRLEQQCAGANTLPLCVLDVVTEQPVGMTTFMSNSPENLKIELGGIWYSPLVQGTHANTEATYLMLGHVFELGYRRVEWKCNDHNYRSRRAALRMGFQFEGIQESHMIVKGRSRDTAWFRMLAHEWPSVKAQLETLLYG
jgi:RimJ/RimL family protein N-acetyltransferase